MSSGSQPRPERRLAESSAFLVASFVLHGLVFGLLGMPELPDPGFELTLPNEIEFGLMEPGGGGDQSETSPPPAPPEPPVQDKPRPKPEPAPRPRPEVSDAPSLGPVVDAGPSRDASAGDAAVDAGVGDAGPWRDAQVLDAQLGDESRALQASGQGNDPNALGPGLGVGLAGHGLGGYAPPGAQIGLHVNMDILRTSSLILETHALLEVIPEWQPMLHGSGLDPFRDLSRIFIATPSLQRSDMVLAARYRGAPEILEQAAARLSRERRRPFAFERSGALRHAPWASRGPTARIIALTGQGEFVITKKDDLPRVLAVARAVESRAARDPNREKASGAAALLAMYEDEAVALSVEGARRFVKGDLTAVPGALRMSVQAVDEFHARIVALGVYESPARAAEALRRIDGLRREWIDHPRASYLGIKNALESAELERDGENLIVRVKVTLHQTRYLLAYVTRVLHPRD